MDQDNFNQWLMFCASDPTSPDGSIIYNNDGKFITDSSGITELIFKNGVITGHYPGPPSSEWYFNKTNGHWTQGTWPVPVTDRLSKWGANGHFWGGTAYSKDAQTVTKLVAAGCNTYRVGYAFGDLGRFQQFISAYAAPNHIAVYPVALIGATADESSGYVYGYSMGVEMSGLKNYVPIYEFPNEYAGYCLNAGADGNSPSHYDAALFKVARGLFRGFRDGVLSRHPTAKFAGPTDTWLHTAFGQMLYDGTSPDNLSPNAALRVRWDLTTWHWYSDMGNIESAGGPQQNVLSTIAAWGAPIRINEYGCRFSSFSDETAVTNYLTGTNLMGKWEAVKATYNITGSDYYELYDDGQPGDEGQFGIVLADAVSNKPIRFSAFAAYIVGHQ